MRPAAFFEGTEANLRHPMIGCHDREVEYGSRAAKRMHTPTMTTKIGLVHVAGETIAV